MATPAIFEILRDASKQTTEGKKADFLRKVGDNFAIKSILQGCFNPAVKFLLPLGAPPYQEADPTMVETRLYSMSKRFNIFVENGRAVASQTKREMMFIELLESIHPEDAKVVLNMVAKKEPWEGITHAVAHKAFPNHVPAPEVIVEEPVAEEVPVKKTRAKAKPKSKKSA
jgi:hypothetical protein